MSDQTINTPSQESERYRQAQERATQLKHIHEKELVLRVFEESGLHFKISNEQVLAGLGTVDFDADSVPVVNGVPLSTALQTYATVNPMALAETVAERHDRGASTVKSKQDLRSVRERVDFINAHGELAYSRLPAMAPQEFDETKLTFEEYRKLPVSVKTKLVEKHGPGFAARLARTASEQTRIDRLNGVPTGTRR